LDLDFECENLSSNSTDEFNKIMTQAILTSRDSLKVSDLISYDMTTPTTITETISQNHTSSKERSHGDSSKHSSSRQSACTSPDNSKNEQKKSLSLLDDSDFDFDNSTNRTTSPSVTPSRGAVVESKSEDNTPLTISSDVGMESVATIIQEETLPSDFNIKYNAILAQNDADDFLTEAAVPLSASHNQVSH